VLRLAFKKACDDFGVQPKQPKQLAITTDNA